MHLVPARTPPPPSADAPIGDRRAGRMLMLVLWPSFLVAVVGTGLVFAMVDPHELVLVGLHLAHSREGAYTVGFLLLWALLAGCSALTLQILRAGDPSATTGRSAPPAARAGAPRSCGGDDGPIAPVRRSPPQLRLLVDTRPFQGRRRER